MLIEKTNRQLVYDLTSEQRKELKTHLMQDNPKYKNAKRYSGYKNVYVPKYLEYFEEFSVSAGDGTRKKVLSVPIGVNVQEVLECNEIQFKDGRTERQVKYPKFKLELRNDQKIAEKHYLEEIKKEYPKSIIQLPTGKGKAQPLYTDILTPKGFVKMGDIKVGDYVIGSNGKKAKVLGVYPQGKKPVYEITFKDGSTTRCSDEHLWWYRTHNMKKFGTPYKVGTLNDIMRLPLKNGRSFNIFIPKNKPIEDFSSESLPLDPYALGCLIGDGCIHQLNSKKQSNCYFSNVEDDIVDKLNTCMKNLGKFVKNTYTQCQYIFKSEEGVKNSRFRKILNELGVCVKGNDKFIPEIYLKAGKKDRLKLLQGLFDTDGCVRPNGSYEFCTSSEKLAKDVMFLSRSLGYRCTLNIHDRVGNTYITNEREYTRKSKEYYVCIQTHDKIFTSKKHEYRDKKARDSHIRQEKYEDLAILDILYIGDEECQCIMVDNEDHTYICDDFIVTHNTVVGLHIAYTLKQKTLVLVHKDDLVVGWKKDIKLCFGDKVDIGLIKAKSRKVGSQITITTVQTLSRMSEEELSNYTNEFGLVIQDETHRVGATIFNIIDQFNSKYKLGLSATVKRGDGLDCVFDYFFGGIGYKHIVTKEDEDICDCEVRVLDSNFKYKPFVYKKQVFNYYDFKKEDLPTHIQFVEEMDYKKRPRISYGDLDNEAVRSPLTKVLVCKKIIEHYKQGHSIIVFFTQKEHIELYFRHLSRYIPKDKIMLYYGDSKEDNDTMMQKAENREVLVTLATLAKATEGTNVKSWEVAFLVSSMNSQKNVEQAVGRVRRRKKGKIDKAIVYDVRYSDCYTLRSHFNTRRSVYSKLKFDIIDPKRNSGSMFSRGYKN